MERSHEDSLVGEMPALRRYALVLTRSQSDAEDLLHDTLSRAIARKDRYEAGTSLRSWTFAIMHNAFCDDRRRLRRRQEFALSGEEIPLSERTNPDALNTIYDFKQAFAELTGPAREVLLLIGVEGLSYEEAATHLGVPVGTVKSRLFRAREALRGLTDTPAI